MQHILVAYDASEQANKAFDFALELANKYQAQLTILAVAPVVSTSEETDGTDVLQSSLNYYDNSFNLLRRKVTQHYPSMNANFKIVDGAPAEEIIHQAEQLGVDHIVMGHRGLSTFKRWLLGSVAKQVMIYAPCAITIIR